MRTARRAWAYADAIERLNGHIHVVFRVPEDTGAYRVGLRYATCLATEKADYERGGAVFIKRRVKRETR